MTKRTTGKQKSKQLLSLERAEEAVSLCKRGWPEHRIAKQVGVSERQVRNYLKNAREKAAERFRENAELHAELQLEKLAEVRSAAWEGWKKSLRSDLSQTESSTTHQDGFSNTTSKSRRRSNGDARFLGVIARAIDSESKILGVYDRQPDEEVGQGDAPQIVTIVVDSREERDMVLSYSQFREKIEPPKQPDKGD